MNPNNDVLFYRLRKGDKKALDDIYKLYHGKIYGFALSYLKSEEEALDVVQESFIKLWESRSSLKKGTKLEAFIFTVTKNSILSIFRKLSTEKRYLEYLSNSVITNTSGTEEMTDLEFLQDQYEQLIPNLPPKQREIFLLSRHEGLSNKDIARQRGISEKTVENHITKALAYFKENMDQLGIWGGLFYILYIS